MGLSDRTAEGKKDLVQYYHEHNELIQNNKLHFLDTGGLYVCTIHQSVATASSDLRNARNKNKHYKNLNNNNSNSNKYMEYHEFIKIIRTHITEE